MNENGGNKAAPFIFERELLTRNQAAIHSFRYLANNSFRELLVSQLEDGIKPKALAALTASRLLWTDSF